MNKKIYLFKKYYFKLLGKNEKLMSLNIRYYRSVGVKIGENMRAFSPLLTAEPYLLEFGNNITISSNVTFITHDNSVTKIVDNATDVFGRIKVGKNCFIGHGSIILPGVTLGDNVIVGSGSVVTKSFPLGDVVIGGNPAKVICTTKDYFQKINPHALNTIGMSNSEKKNYILNLPSQKFVVK
ncbi:acyltransferase [Gottfriedia sp. S16(2024)]